MLWHQVIIRLSARPRGFHLITSDVLHALPQVQTVQAGLLHLFLQHTSASLAVNENADPDVRADMNRWANQAIPDGAPYFVHTDEGLDDMSAHVKAALFGTSLSLPVRGGRLALGTWQGIYLGEHRDNASARSIVATLCGQPIENR